MRDIDHPVQEDTQLQTRTWLVQRIAWLLFALIPVAALTGLFAHGFLSASTIGDAGSFSVNFERFQRITRHALFTFHFAPQQTADLHLEAPFQRIYLIEKIQPAPAQDTSTGREFNLSFNKNPGQPLVVQIWAKPQTFGWFKLAAQSGVKKFPFNVLIYP